MRGFALCLADPCRTLGQLWLSRFTEMRDLMAQVVRQPVLTSEPTQLRQTRLLRLAVCIRTRDGTSADSTSHKLDHNSWGQPRST